MSFPSASLRSARLAALLSLGLGLAQAKGILVRFLAGPAEDSIVRYEVYRADAPGASALPIGKVAAVPGADTLVFSDLTAEKGRPYTYRVTSVNGEGGESDPSEQTQVAFPFLSLPDTLRPDKTTGLTRMVVPSSSDPLRGTAPLALALIDSSRFTLAFDAASHTAVLRSRSGKSDSAWTVVRAGYFDKFEDRDSVLVVVAGPATVSVAFPPDPGRAGKRSRRGALPPLLWNGRNAAGRMPSILR
jgi:hypothetical protein